MRIGAKLPNSGPLPLELGIPALARTLEDVRFRLALGGRPHRASARDPVPLSVRLRRQGDLGHGRAVGRRDGRAGARRCSDGARAPRHGGAGAAAAHPGRARQAGGVDRRRQRRPAGARRRRRLARGGVRRARRAVRDRGSRLEEWIEIARECWTGSPAARHSPHYTLPDGLVAPPTPAHRIPFLIGGHSPAALRRAGRVGEGWLAQQAAGALDPERLARDATAIAAAAPGGRGAARSFCASWSRSAARTWSPQRLAELAEAGVDEVIVDVPPDAAAPSPPTRRCAAPYRHDAGRRPARARHGRRERHRSGSRRAARRRGRRRHRRSTSRRRWRTSRCQAVLPRRRSTSATSRRSPRRSRRRAAARRARRGCRDRPGVGPVAAFDLDECDAVMAGERPRGGGHDRARGRGAARRRARSSSSRRSTRGAATRTSPATWRASTPCSASSAPPRSSSAGGASASTRSRPGPVATEALLARMERAVARRARPAVAGGARAGRRADRTRPHRDGRGGRAARSSSRATSARA